MGFADVADPTGRLVAPKVDGDKEEPEGGIVKDLLSFGDVLSPSWVISKGLELAFDFNPVDEAKKLIAGDWEEYAECAKAWKAMGDFCEDLAENIRAGNRALDKSWNGNAADAAYIYFDTLAKDIADMKHSFNELKESYEKTTEAVWNTAEACGDLLQGILDTAAIVGLTALAGASTSFTLFGPVIAVGAVAGEIIAMINMWSKLTTAISELQTMLNGSIGLVTGISSSIEAKAVKFPLPGRAYDSPVA
ncbi:hypothetical protein [Streptomyces gilvosporeus]|uniref:WXG100 family type VII secretion target n=1 Tax=Streptomyces gilvosporeus TaxID=553510 RepID=A0A1V0TSN2_9ACTN|nr:hypothetical protein [Streptomyces gilvosporeus]ARF55778.1 hypothetical protein B1H19_17745 [Streptomyces gilvosporeus]